MASIIRPAVMLSGVIVGTVMLITVKPGANRAVAVTSSAQSRRRWRLWTR